MRRRDAPVKPATGGAAGRTRSAVAEAARRLPRARRREQLLDTAHVIVREEGTDALTLGHLAERAGVSKPIAYEHFTSRAGLLIALYEQIDDRAVAALRHAVEQAPHRLEDVARVASAASMHCYRAVGPEWHAIAAALKGDEEMEAVQQALLDRYVALYREAFAPYSTLPDDELHVRCLGIVGAADAIAREMMRGRIDESKAAASLTALIVDWLSPKRRTARNRP
jgi:AcrR family transcriptional regulator